eukprot:g22929.t1
MELLMARGASITQRTKEANFTPLLWAAAGGHIQAAKSLLEAVTRVGFTPVLRSSRGFSTKARSVVFPVFGTRRSVIRASVRVTFDLPASVPIRR